MLECHDHANIFFFKLVSFLYQNTNVAMKPIISFRIMGYHLATLIYQLQYDLKQLITPVDLPQKHASTPQRDLTLI